MEIVWSYSASLMSPTEGRNDEKQTTDADLAVHYPDDLPAVPGSCNALHLESAH